MGIFADYAPVYADMGVRTFPVSVDDQGKRPAVRGYLKASDRTRQAWADSPKFAGYDALGIDLRRSGITVLDIDEPDENLMADAMDAHGPTPFVVRSQSGHFQLFFANSGEPRDTSKRRWNRRIDLLGGGFTVAAPSKVHNGDYQIIVGDLEDLSNLPRLKNLPEPAANDDGVIASGQTVTRGRRNNALYVYAMRAAHECEVEPELLDKAKQYAATFDPPLDEAEIMQTVKSAWAYTLRGDNYVQQAHTRMLNAEIDTLAKHQPDAYLLLSILRRHQWGGDDFMIANGMANNVVPFSRKRLSKARQHLMRQGYIVQVRPPTNTWGEALYAWPTV